MLYYYYKHYTSLTKLTDLEEIRRKLEEMFYGSYYCIVSNRGDIFKHITVSRKVNGFLNSQNQSKMN